MKEIEIPENFAVDEADKFRDNVYYLIDNGERHFILNFKKCTFIDSTGLGVLVSLYKRCIELNGTLKMHSITPEVNKVLKLTRLDSVFNIVK